MSTKRLRGKIGSFPLFAPTDENQPAPAAELTIWVGATDHLLAAIQVRPLDDEGRPASDGEFFLLRGHASGDEQDYSERDGVMMPSRLYILRSRGENRDSLAKIDIMAIDLDPALTLELMRRPES